ncbi:polyurethanase [Serratia rubidaea]|uniref:polyurethane esterase n=1 Tax=Serratia rubidaea TaxID=61652 RepID=UPI001F2739FF|nr:polyurethanase [Serratia rubidaea]UJD80177.1 polyurethanase [Serratia rubidaea]UJD84733.1 polyurethanase [Serratia rubidaea]
MGIFDYRETDAAASKTLFADAMAISHYAYHNIDNGFAVGYQHNGYGLGLPLTLVGGILGSSDSQGALPGIPWNPDAEKAALEAVTAAGWTRVSAQQLGYQGKTDQRGTYFGESKGYETAQAEVLAKYDDAGTLTEIGIAFRGTSGPRESIISDSIGDVINDLLAGFGPAGYADHYALNAFNTLLGDVARFAQQNGLSGEDVVVSGHSLGGMAVNSMASMSDAHWGGFYSHANYVAFASPTQHQGDDRVLNIGYENDPVFRALDGSTMTAGSLGVHDGVKEHATNNIVNFNDHYASAAWNALPFSILNIPTWLSHLPSAYQDGLTRVLDSAFYALTEQNSTVIVSNLSDVTRGDTWVTDLNRNAETHSGPTFIIGSDGNDLIKGGQGNDYLEGRAGDDTFRDGGGYNWILGGDGSNTLDIEQSLQQREVAYDGVNLYLRDADGGITLAENIATLRSKESQLIVLNKNVDHQVTADGLLSASGLTAYADSLNGGDGADSLTATQAGGWLFGLAGDDTLNGQFGGHTFVGGAGNDQLQAGGGNNTFLFSGSFGHDRLEGWQASDKLVFIGAGSQVKYHQADNNLTIGLGDNSVTLVGVSQQSLQDGQLIVA